MLFSNYNFLPFMPFQADQDLRELARQPGKFSVFHYIFPLLFLKFHFASGDSVKTIGLSKNGCSHSGKTGLTGGNKIE